MGRNRWIHAAWPGDGSSAQLHSVGALLHTHVRKGRAEGAARGVAAREAARSERVGDDTRLQAMVC